MAVYLICYETEHLDLVPDTSTAIGAELESIGESTIDVINHNRSWVLKTDITEQEVLNKIGPFLHPEDFIIIPALLFSVFPALISSRAREQRRRFCFSANPHGEREPQ